MGYCRLTCLLQGFIAHDSLKTNAQYYYGLCLANGQGVAQDYSEAARYFKMSADQGNSEAVGYLKELADQGGSLP